MWRMTENKLNFKKMNKFKYKGLVHMAPPANRVPSLMTDLFEWLYKSKDHLLIRSCVFHYEFEFIHPFSDGNGRTGRLWQSLILGKLHPLFEHLPVENIVYANQESYYRAIQESNSAANSAPFIDFMLRKILEALKTHQGPSLSATNDLEIRGKVRDKFGIKSETIIELILKKPAITLDEISELLSVTRRSVEKRIKILKEAGYIKREGSNKTGHWVILKKQ